MRIFFFKPLKLCCSLKFDSWYKYNVGLNRMKGNLCYSIHTPSQPNRGFSRENTKIYE